MSLGVSVHQYVVAVDVVIIRSSIERPCITNSRLLYRQLNTESVQVEIKPRLLWT